AEQPIRAEGDIAGAAEVKREIVTRETVPGDDRPGGCVAVHLAPFPFFELGVETAPEVDPAFVADERVFENEIITTVIDVNTASFEAVTQLAVLFQIVPGNDGLAGVPCPDAADRIADDPIGQVLVAERERVLDPMSSRIREIVSHQ